MILSGMSTGSLYAQQEAMYSQYMFNLLNINPAYAGNRAVHSISMLYRDQWTGIDGAPRTGTLSWDHRSSGTNVGYGLQIGNDKLGIETTTILKGFYSYRIPFEKSTLSLGVDAGILNYRAEYAKVNTVEQGDPLFEKNENRFMPRVGLGCLYESDKIYVGFSIPDLLDTKVSENNGQVNFSPNLHYYLNGGLIFNANENIKLKPSLLLKAVSGAPLQYDFNLNAWFNNTIGLGASYRTNDAVIGMFELQLSSHFRLGYAFDYSITRLNAFNKGTHELMLRFEFNSESKDDKVLSPRYY